MRRNQPVFVPILLSHCLGYVRRRFGLLRRRRRSFLLCLRPASATLGVHFIGAGLPTMTRASTSKMAALRSVSHHPSVNENPLRHGPRSRRPAADWKLTAHPVRWLCSRSGQDSTGASETKRKPAHFPLFIVAQGDGGIVVRWRGSITPRRPGAEAVSS